MANRRISRFGLQMMIFALVLDQASKWYLLTQTDLPFFGSYTVTPFFNLVMVWNKGISFGMFSQHDQPFILIGVACAILLVLFRWLFTAKTRVIAAASGLIIGGAVGNIVDRLRFGAVADFFDFHIDIYHWPAFNVADSAIFIGVVILCIDSMFTARK